MKKIVILLIALVVISVSIFSGCNEEESEKNERSQDTTNFAEGLSLINENFGIALGNIDTHFFNYDVSNKWTVLMNYLTFTESMIEEMYESETDVEDEIVYIENAIDEYQQLKESADLNQLTTSETDIMDEIDMAILDFQLNKDTIDFSLNAMEVYRQFINLSRLKLIMLEDYENTLALMNSKVENEQNEGALVHAEELKQIFNDLKVNENLRANLSIMNYTETDLSVWDLYIEAWELYKEYLNLIIEGRISQADTKYTEYSNKYNEVLEIEAGVSITETNNEIDQWYQDNIAICLDLFEEYL